MLFRSKNFVDAWQLAILFPPMSMDTNERLYMFKESLMFDDVVMESAFFQHPDVQRFLDLWREYVELPKEDLKRYDAMKKAFINAFGIKVFDDYLFNTFFFHRNDYLVLKQLSDTVSRPIA